MASGYEEKSASVRNGQIVLGLNLINKQYHDWSVRTNKLVAAATKDLKRLLRKAKDNKKNKRRRIDHSVVMPPIQESSPLIATAIMPTIMTPIDEIATSEKTNEPKNESCIRRSKRAAAKKATLMTATTLKMSLNAKLRRPTDLPQVLKTTSPSHDSPENFIDQPQQIKESLESPPKPTSKTSGNSNMFDTRKEGVSNEMDALMKAVDEDVVTKDSKQDDSISKNGSGASDNCSQLESLKDSDNQMKNKSGNRSSNYMSANGDLSSAPSKDQSEKYEKTMTEKFSPPSLTQSEHTNVINQNNEQTNVDSGFIEKNKTEISLKVDNDLKSPVSKKGKMCDDKIQETGKIVKPIIVIDECPTINESQNYPDTRKVTTSPPEIKDVIEQELSLLKVTEKKISDPILIQTDVTNSTSPELKEDIILSTTQYNMRTRSKAVKINPTSNNNKPLPRLLLKQQLKVPINSAVPIPKNKVREMVKTVEENILANTPKPVDVKKNAFLFSSGKENSRIKCTNGCSNEKNRKVTPLATNNRIFGAGSATEPYSSGVISKEKTLKETEEAERKRKEEEQLQKLKKEEDVMKKREEKLKANREKLRKKREEKMEKVCRTREAAEREKLEQLAKLEKEREERDQQIKAEIQRQKEEQILKKKQLNLLKAQEAEERRLKEENARIAKLKEMEEEQKRLAELKQKQLEEAERRFQQRQAEELRAKEALKAAQEKASVKQKIINTDAYEMTPPRNEREPMPLKNPDDYGIDDIRPDDSSDDESHPKKEIPMWAQKPMKNTRLKIQSYLPNEILTLFMNPPENTPNLDAVFGRMTTKRVRTSSAVWTHVPIFRS